MRTALGVSFLVSLLAVVGAGCGGDSGGSEDRSAAVMQLESMCDQARADVEALGLPSEGGPEVIGKWAQRGRRLATGVGKLEGETPEERGLLTALSSSLKEYYSGLRLGYIIYTQTGDSAAYALTLDKAKVFRAQADKLAAEIGAPACAKAPFADTESS
jgi:hypothetical protein